MKYHFDLSADDYREMNLAAYRWAAVLLHYFPYALCVALIVFLAVPWALQGTTLGATVAAAITFGAVLSWLSLNWRRRVLGSIGAHYNDAARKVIFGPHTLTFTDAGLESVGPMHRSFRDWRCVTEARVTKTHVLFYTAFGVVYLLPLRAVPDLPALEMWLSERSVKQPNKSLEWTRER